MNELSMPSSERTLLVIASDQANMQIMTLLIAGRDDLNLLTAVNGREGMELADTSQPEVVVLDTSLSDIHANEVLKGLRSNPQTSHIPVIAVSTDAYPAQIHAGLQAGFYRYLTKPYKLTDFLEAIDGSLNYSHEKSVNAIPSLSV
jgi:CheY-like chemotaxis protein